MFDPPCINQVHNIQITNKMHFNVYDVVSIYFFAEKSVIKIRHKHFAFCWLFIYYVTIQRFKSELLLRRCVACFVLTDVGKISNTHQWHFVCYTIFRELYITVQEDPENGDTTFLQNVGNYLSFDKAYHPSRLQSASTQTTSFSWIVCLPYNHEHIDILHLCVTCSSCFMNRSPRVVGAECPTTSH